MDPDFFPPLLSGGSWAFAAIGETDNLTNPITTFCRLAEFEVLTLLIAAMAKYEE